jgi:hypothetical protein
MRRRFPGVLAAGAFLASFLSSYLAWTGPACAAPLPVVANLQLDLATLSPFLSGSGVATAPSSDPLSGLALPSDLVVTSALVIPITDPAAAPLQGYELTVRNGAGSFAPSAGVFGGVMPLIGSIRVCLFAPCPVAVANLTVPLTVIGAGGAATRPAPGLASLTVTGAPWTTGTVMLPFGIGGPDTIMGYAHGPASATSSTAQPGGSLQLVTPFTFMTSFQADGPTRGFAALTLHFVPEASSALLLAGGIALLGGIGARRRSS